MAEGAEAMGKFIRENRPHWDLFALSEDFNFEDELKTGLQAEGNYTFGTKRESMWAKATILTDPFDTDGLNLMVRNASGITFSGEKYVRFNKSYGKTDSGSDELIKKGFRYYLVDFGEGLQCDLYIHHMDAETDDKSNAARADNVSQVVQAIIDSNTTRPVIIMGDTNCRYTRDDLQSLLFDKINATGYLQVRDPWVDFNWYGINPALGTPAIMTHTYGAQRGEVVDKIWYINNKHAKGVKLTANSYLNDDDFKSPTEGVNFADHTPVVVNFTIEQTSNPDDVFVPDPEAPANPFSTEKYYLRNAGGEDLYITGGGEWDTQTMLDQTGFGFTIELGDKPNTFAFKGTNANGFLWNGLYLDNAKTDWYVTAVSDETSELYVLSIMDGGVMKTLTKIENNDKTPYYHPDYTVTLQEYVEGNHDQQWELITEAERDHRLAENVHSDPTHWRDATYKIPSFNFTNTYTCADFGKWSRTADKTYKPLFGSTTTYAASAIVSGNNGSIFKYYNTSDASNSRKTEFSMSTTLTGLPNGTYRFKCQAYVCNLNGNTSNLTIYVGDKSINPRKDGNDVVDFETVGETFRDDANWLTLEDINVKDEELTIKFEKAHTTSATAFYIDNLRLEYISPEVDPEPTEIELGFPNHYNTMILPFALDKSKVAEMASDGLRICRVEGYTSGESQTTELEGEIEYHKIMLSEPLDETSANVPYIVINENVEELVGRPMEGSDAAKAPMARAAGAPDYVVTFSGQPVNKNYYYTDPDDSQNTLTGVLVNTYVYSGHYSLGGGDYLQAFVLNESDEAKSIDAYRAYINSVTTTDNEHAMFVFNDDTNLLTGVEKVTDEAEAASADAPIEFYNLQGIRVENPSNGIFIRRQGTKVSKVAL